MSLILKLLIVNEAVLFGWQGRRSVQVGIVLHVGDGVHVIVVVYFELARQVAFVYDEALVVLKAEFDRLHYNLAPIFGQLGVPGTICHGRSGCYF